MTSPLDTLATAAAQLEDAAATEAAPHEPNAAERIMALQEEIEQLREQAAAENASKPFVLHTVAGAGTIGYQTVAGDTIDAIAARFGLSNAHEQVFKPNMARIEESARAAGFRGGSDQGSILPAGTWLELPASLVARKPE